MTKVNINLRKSLLSEEFIKQARLSMRFNLTKSSTALLVFAVLLTTATSETRARDFDRLNNDFGWKHLPCSFLNENTVYIILTAFCTKSTIICVEGNFKCGTEG